MSRPVFILVRTESCVEGEDGGFSEQVNQHVTEGYEPCGTAIVQIVPESAATIPGPGGRGKYTRTYVSYSLALWLPPFTRDGGS